MGGTIDIYPHPETEVTIDFEPDRINALLGTRISTEDMLKIFDRIELAYDKASNKIIVPNFRRDLHATCDLAE